MEFPNSLLSVSETVGSNKLLVQGPGGNISYKNNDSLFIKASGACLIDANKKDIFVKTNLAKIRISIEKDHKDPLLGSWNLENKLRPSIETSLHALMPQNCVLHVHCVNTLSWVVQNKYENKVREYLNGIEWLSLPYKKPGYELTKALKKVLKKNYPEVILLSNHGFIAGADNPLDVLKLVQDVSKRLSIKTNKFIPQNIPKLRNFSSSIKYKLPKYPHVHSLASSKNSISIVSKGFLFPDQLVFLGSRVRVIEDMEKFLQSNNNLNESKSILLIPDLGLLVPEGFSETSEEMLYGLALIVERIPTNASINYLSKEEENELIKWDAEKYRKSMNK